VNLGKFIYLYESNGTNRMIGVFIAESGIVAMQRKRKVEIRQTISDASSKEDSETIEQIDPEEAKRARR